MVSKKCIFIFTLQLVALFSDTSACGSRRGRGSRGHWGHSSHSSWHGSSSSHHQSSSHHYPSHSSDSSHSSGYHSGSSHHESHPSYNPHPSHTNSDSHTSHTNFNPSSHHQSTDNGHGSHGPYDHQVNPHVNPQPVHESIPIPIGVQIPNIPGFHHHPYHYIPGSRSHATGTTGQNSPSSSSQSDGSSGTVVQDSPNSSSQSDGSFGTAAQNSPSAIEDVSWLQLSCNERLCEHTKNYPLKEVESAIEKIKSILSTDGLSADISSDVRGFLSNTNKVDFNIKIENSTGCQEDASTLTPLGGYDINRRPFIIVNVPNLSQTVKLITCRTYDFCNTKTTIELPYMCRQTHRHQELLVLPVKQGSFNHTDFSVATFEVRNGCNCVSFEEAFQIPRFG